MHGFSSTSVTKKDCCATLLDNTTTNPTGEVSAGVVEALLSDLERHGGEGPLED